MSESRAIAAFTGVGLVLVGLAIGLPRLTRPRSPVDLLPPVTTATAVVPLGVPAAPPAPPARNAPRLLQHPTLSRAQIAFDYAGEIWTVSRDGGEARRVVTGQLENSRPIFSPDGTQLAFSGTYDRNQDVYVVPAAGGEPRRLTHHPSGDEPLGFVPDGTRVLFRSRRATSRDLAKLFTVPLTGGLPTELPLPSADEASYSPDGTRLAYIPFDQWEPGWNKYRGGQTTPIWLADLSDLARHQGAARTDSNDRFPMWVGDTVYFVSDRNGPYTLFAFDTKGTAVRELAPQSGRIWHSVRHRRGLAASCTSSSTAFTSTTSPRSQDVARRAGDDHGGFAAGTGALRAHATTSAGAERRRSPPPGKRALFESHGEILSVPAEKGDVRNLTHSPGVADRDPAWSPDGKWVAWLSDESGEYALYFRSPDGIGPVKKIDAGRLAFLSSTIRAGPPTARSSCCPTNA